MNSHVCMLLVVTALAWNASAAESSAPAKVGDEAAAIMAIKLNIAVDGMTLDKAMDWYKMLSDNAVPVQVSAGAAPKKVTLKLEDATWAEALRKIAAQTGVKYRVSKGVIQIGTPEEFDAIEKGKAEFKPAPIAPPAKQEAPKPVEKKTGALPKNSIFYAKVGDWNEYTLTHVDKDHTSLHYIKFTVESIEKSGGTVLSYYTSLPETGRSSKTLHTTVYPATDRRESEWFWFGEGKRDGDIQTEGDETLTLAGKPHNTHFIELEYHNPDHNDKEKLSVKLWLSPDVPMGGTAKSIRRFPDFTQTLEFVGSGHANAK